jgi:toxin YhaV
MPIYAERHGWKLFQYPAFKERFSALEAEVTLLRKRQTEDYPSHPKAKLLKRILDLIEEEIPRNPGAPEYLQGNTLGPAYRHWRRAKFLGRFRLFFRYSSQEKIILYAWVSDENTLRKAGAKTDPYALFQKRLLAGDPPDDWDDLMKQVR